MNECQRPEACLKGNKPRQPRTNEQDNQIPPGSKHKRAGLESIESGDCNAEPFLAGTMTACGPGGALSKLAAASDLSQSRATV